MKHLISIAAALSFLLVMLGAVFKIQSWEGADYFLVPGMILLPMALLCVVIAKLVRSKKDEDTLELDASRINKRDRAIEKISAGKDELTL